MHRGVGTAEAYSGHCFAALMKERRENGVRGEKIVELQVKVAQWKKLSCINSHHKPSPWLVHFLKSFKNPQEPNPQHLGH